ncbi:MAG: Ig-like domain-containing protein [Bacteroidota bacterium]|nr:Ig-like domain-containing protein [Bacteroidota bacterium]
MKAFPYLLYIAACAYILTSCDSLTNEDVKPESFTEIQLNKNHYRTTINNRVILDFLENDKIGENAILKVGNPLHGSLSPGMINTIFFYEPSNSFSGADSIPYKICIGNRCDSAIVVIHVDDPQQVPCPTAIDDFVTTTMNNPVQINVTNNDHLCGLGTLSIITNPKNGILIYRHDSITYQPKANFYGNDIFKYQHCSGNDCSSAMVFISVLEKDTVNACEEIIFEVNDFRYELIQSDSAKNILNTHYLHVQSNDILSCPNYNISLKITEGPNKGSAAVINNVIEYTPHQKGSVSDKLKYQTCVALAGHTECTEAWAYIEIK